MDSHFPNIAQNMGRGPVGEYSYIRNNGINPKHRLHIRQGSLVTILTEINYV